MILSGQCVLWLLEDTDKCFLIQSVKSYNDRNSSDEFRDKTKFDKIFRHDILEDLTDVSLFLDLYFCTKTDRLRVLSCLDRFLDPVKSTAADKQDICRIDLKEFLMWVLTTSLRRYVCNGSLEDLQKCLLNALTGYITGDGCVFGFSGDLVDLINIDDSVLCTFNVIVCCLDQFQKDILHILTDITGLCQCCSVCNSKRHIQKTGKCLCKQSFTGTGRSKHQDVALL